MLRLSAVTKTFEARGRSIVAVEDVNLDVPPQGFVTVVGPSGCGKSTLLNLVSGLESATSGEITFKGKPITPGDRKVGYVTQQDNLFPWRHLVDNIAFPLEVSGVQGAEAKKRARHWIEKVGLAGFEESYPYEMSGGMRQRANIARTLIYEPELIMMDEPFGPLDAQTRLQLQTELLRIWKDTRVSVLFITHDLSEAVALSSQVVIMSARPGRIEKICDIDLPYPRNIGRIHDNENYRRIYDELWDTLERVVRDAQAPAHRASA
jgi:NitT/TauT family transport system ATP-binding protein